MINVLFFLKAFFDMLWEYKALLVVLFLLLSVYVMPRVFFLKINFVNALLVLLSILFLRSFIVDINMDSAIDFMKIFSAFLCFFAAQWNNKPSKTVDIISFSFIFPVIYILFLLVTGQGYQYWGFAKTFIGPYFFKTDLALVIMITLVFFRKYLFFSHRKSFRVLTFIYILIVAPLIIYLTNARITLIVYAVYLALLFMEYYRYKFKVPMAKIIKILGVIIIFVSVIAINTYYSEKNDNASYLTLSFNPADAFSKENTQGRSIIWELILDKYSEGHLFYKTFGYSIEKDVEFNTYLHNHSHNNFLKVLISTGFIGFLAYSLFWILIFLKLYKLFKGKFTQDEYYYLYTILMLVVIFNIMGMTNTNLIYTQSTWYTFYLMGLLFNKNLLNSK